jgi:DNA-binding cell septation regulator SpoVG
MTKSAPEITEVKIRVAPGTDGLLGWASCVVNRTLVVNDIAIRRGKDNSLFLTYPTKVSGQGKRHPTYFPIDRETSQAFEDAIVGELRRLAGLTASGPEGA